MSDSEEDYSSSEGEQLQEEEEEEATSKPEEGEKQSDKDKTSKRKVTTSAEIQYKQKVFIMYGDESWLLEHDPLIISIPHPKRGTPARFILSNGKLLEIQRTICDPSAWFIDNSVQQGE
jgi:hypothetical protein